MRVKIKSWEKMEKEFGLDGDWINCECIFTDEMENAMPQDRIIDVQYGDENMSEFLQSLGYNGEQISEIVLTGKCNQD